VQNLIDAELAGLEVMGISAEEVEALNEELLRLGFNTID
jgi:hypothetical protein